MSQDKEGCYKMIKESVHTEDVTIINTYESNIRAPITLSKHWQTEGRNRQQYHNHKQLQYPTFDNKWNIQMKD